MEREIEFKSEIDLEPMIHDMGDVDAEKDLGVSEIEELPEIDTREQIEVTMLKKRENIREKLAIVFSAGLFIVIIIGILIGFFANEQQIDNIISMILAISGILTGPLGFILG